MSDVSVTVSANPVTVSVPQGAQGPQGDQGPGGPVGGLTYATVADLEAATVPSDGTLAYVRGYSTANDGGQGYYRYSSGSSATVDHGLVATAAGGTGRWLRQYSGAINACWFGAKGDGTTNDATAFQAAHDAAPVGGVIYLPRPSSVYRLNSAINITTRDLTWHGDGGQQTVIQWHGTGDGPFVIGSDNGHAYDAADYDGTQGVAFRGIGVTVASAQRDTALDNGLSNYLASSKAIVDWRGGRVLLDDVSISYFDYAFWGIQSDVNQFSRVILNNNHHGIYLGPRSDQAVIDDLWSFQNDRALWIDSAKGCRVRAWQSDSDGTTTHAAAVLDAAYARGLSTGSIVTSGIVFEDCWFENFTGGTGQTVPAFVEAGIGTSYKIGIVIVRGPLIETNASGTTPRTSYLIKSDQTTGIRIEDWSGAGPGNLDALVETVNTGTPYLWFRDAQASTVTILQSDHTAGSVQVDVTGHQNGSYPAVDGGNGGSFSYIRHNSGTQAGMRSTNRRYYVTGTTTNNERDFYIGAEADGEFTVKQFNSATGNTTRLAIDRRITYGSAAPTTGTWAQGDIQFNRAPSAGGNVGWICVTAGSPGTWKSFGTISA